jgi:hypothetical protein
MIGVGDCDPKVVNVSRGIGQCCMTACFALLTLQPALAADWIVRDPSGGRLETLGKSYDDRLIRRDGKGRRLGTVELGHGDRLVIRDGRGRRAAVVEEGSAGV